MATDIRPAAVAGSWYPGSAERLAREVDDYIGRAQVDTGDAPIAIVAPHAGLKYSGPVAAFAYRAVQPGVYDAAVLVGPSHFIGFSGVSIWPRGAWRSPAPLCPARMRAVENAAPRPPADTPHGAIVVHLIDGTYELFRHFYGLRRFNKGRDKPFGAVAGVLHSVLEFVERGETCLGVATDHVIESFRNRLWAGYKTGDGIEPALRSQFQPLEDALEATGIAVWPMTELEADDALASAARIASADARVGKVCIWTPDKDLAQCVQGDRVVQVHGRVRRRERPGSYVVPFSTVARSTLSSFSRSIADSIAVSAGPQSGAAMVPAPKPSARFSYTFCQVTNAARSGVDGSATIL